MPFPRFSLLVVKGKQFLIELIDIFRFLSTFFYVDVAFCFWRFNAKNLWLLCIGFIMFTTISSPSLFPPDRSGTHWITFSTFTVFILATFKFLFPLCQKNVKLTSVKINSVKRHREQKRNENRSIFRLWHPHQQHSPVSKHMRWKRIIRVKRKFFVEKYSCGYIESCWLFLVRRHRSFLSIVKILIIFSCDELRRQERGEKTFFSFRGFCHRLSAARLSFISCGWSERN